jgi:hypothetical protein
VECANIGSSQFATILHPPRQNRTAKWRQSSTGGSRRSQTGATFGSGLKAAVRNIRALAIAAKRMIAGAAQTLNDAG